MNGARIAKIGLAAVVLAALACSPAAAPLPGMPQVDTGVDPEAWVTVPAGPFLLGQHRHPAATERPFEIMVTHVTTAQYARYLEAAVARGAVQLDGDAVRGHYPGEPFHAYKHEEQVTAGLKLHAPLAESGVRLRRDGERFTAAEGYERHPMVMVTWFGAQAYCAFHGWRLPTELEWEKAARGTDARAYPWGDELSRRRANYYSSGDPLEKLLGQPAVTTPVGFYAGGTHRGFATEDGRSPYGLHDMAGNVWQWTADDAPDTHLRSLRGGSAHVQEQHLRVWARNSAGPEYYGISAGFRCAREVTP